MLISDDLLHRELKLVFGFDGHHRRNVVEDCVCHDEEEGGSNHPEQSCSSTDEVEDGHRAEADDAVLLDERQFVTEHDGSPDEAAGVEVVAHGEGGEDGEEEQRRRDHAVQEEPNEDEQVIALEVLDVLDDPPWKPLG